MPRSAPQCDLRQYRTYLANATESNTTLGGIAGPNIGGTGLMVKCDDAPGRIHESIGEI
jgi:hypothetical protein